MPAAQGGQATRDCVLRHLAHVLQVCDEDHVGIGTDGAVSPVMVDDRFKAEHVAFVRGRKAAGIAAPGEDKTVYDFVADYNTPDRISRIVDDLARRGYPALVAEKVAGADLARLFASVWG